MSVWYLCVCESVVHLKIISDRTVIIITLVTKFNIQQPMLHELAISSMSLQAVQWAFQAVPWACKQFLELPSSSFCLQAIQWACKQFNELAGSSMTLPAVPGACMQLYKLHAGPLACIQFLELNWSTKNVHVVPWACMQFLSLSEQLTRILHCLFNPKVPAWKCI